MKSLIWLNDQWMWIRSFLSEKPPYESKGSSFRVAALALIWLFILITFRVAMHNWVIPDIPENWVWLIGFILFAFIAEKWLSKPGNIEKIIDKVLKRNGGKVEDIKTDS